MTYFPIPVEEFPGLDLLNDPGEVGFSGAIDVRNVDFDRRGRLRSRNGYSKFTSASAATAYTSIFPWTAGSSLLAMRSGNMDAIGTGGAVAASTAVVGTPGSATAFGVPGASKFYIGFGNGGTVRTWDGSVWANTALGGAFVAATSDQRLAYAGGTLGGSRVKFSDPGAPTTIGANNYVDLDPGDGEHITGLVAWRDSLFAFKETKFYVFYGTSTDSSGNPIFNYRTIKADAGAALCGAASTYSGQQMVCAGRNGVYFVNSRGIYRTTGGEPELLSQPLDPLFLGEGIPTTFTGSSPDLTSVPGPSITAHRERVYFYPGNVDTWVWDPSTGWNVWRFVNGATGLASWSTGGSGVIGDLYFSSGTDIYKLSSAATTDNGNAITGYYQSGFENLAPPRRYIDKYGFGPSRKRVRSWRVAGTGTVTMSVAADEGALKGATSLTLGVSPAIAEARYSNAIRGAKISYKLSGVGPWAVNDLVAMLADTRQPGSDVSDG